ncbi:MAG: hypothetical protein HGB29_09665 [Chlorobiaceae bacterium]|nr:hypothetical protein [Chlorobiaceae bacterium]NTW75118.1 hypothetical protein [Chlorobiaceae bacterium]
MGTIEDYRSGRVLEGIEIALRMLDRDGEPYGISAERAHIEDKIRAFRPMVISEAAALDFVENARIVAIGTRVCHALHPDSPPSATVFLDELADAMIEAGKAVHATPEEAGNALKKRPRHPLVISMVSGAYREICASYRPDCVFWRSAQQGTDVFERRGEKPETGAAITDP